MFWDKCTIQSGVFSLIPSFVIPGIGLQISYTVKRPFHYLCKMHCMQKKNNLLSCTWSMMWLWSSVFSFLKNCFWLEIIITNKTTVCLPNGPPNFNFSPLQEWNWLARPGNGTCVFPALHILYLSQISINQQNYHLINKFVAESVNTQFSSLKHCTAEEKYILQKSYKEVHVHVQCTVCIMICMQNTTNIILNLWVLWVHPNGIFHLIFVHRGFFHLFTI